VIVGGGLRKMDMRKEVVSGARGGKGGRRERWGEEGEGGERFVGLGKGGPRGGGGLGKRGGEGIHGKIR